VQAFEVYALDYLTKPVEPSRMRATLLRVKEHIASKSALTTHEELKSVPARLEKRRLRERSI
jgi:two-component system LytT family response regulator